MDTDTHPNGSNGESAEEPIEKSQEDTEDEKLPDGDKVMDVSDDVLDEPSDKASCDVSVDKETLCDDGADPAENNIGELATNQSENSSAGNESSDTGITEKLQTEDGDNLVKESSDCVESEKVSHGDESTPVGKVPETVESCTKPITADTESKACSESINKSELQEKVDTKSDSNVVLTEGNNLKSDVVKTDSSDKCDDDKSDVKTQELPESILDGKSSSSGSELVDDKSTSSCKDSDDVVTSETVASADSSDQAKASEESVKQDTDTKELVNTSDVTEVKQGKDTTATGGDSIGVPNVSEDDKTNIATKTEEESTQDNTQECNAMDVDVVVVDKKEEIVDSKSVITKDSTELIEIMDDTNTEQTQSDSAKETESSAVSSSGASNAGEISTDKPTLGMGLQSLIGQLGSKLGVKVDDLPDDSGDADDSADDKMSTDSTSDEEEEHITLTKLVCYICIPLVIKFC